MRMPTSALIAQSRGKAAKKQARATIDVQGPSDLCRVQATTRELCRSLDVDESAVFNAVIVVSEIAHRHIIERSRSGSVVLSAVRVKNSLRLDVGVRAAEATVNDQALVSLSFPLAAASPYS